MKVAPNQEAGTYPGLDFGQAELSAVMRETYDELIEFVTEPAFKAIHHELMDQPPQERPAYVARVLMQPDELARRGVTVPEGVLIQRSAFGDRRPTLYVVKKYLPEKYHGAWENVNLTFDNEYEDEEVPRAPELAWRPPLPVALQSELMEHGINLQSVPTDIDLRLRAHVQAR
ncbi:hypothetical protein [Streptomyces platensis]|uniref:hypothetical protein n=1 Tax=Streptomyces platensis TaxID=58346 RepID=UPI001F18401B|nr:hypothetical protein [Streptomyces platensis]MCF3145767.1 hypothetical protein [Streptomyces platensis]